MVDLSPLTPEARPIAGRAAAVYLRHAVPWFGGLLVHGSALKGGFIPGCSDIDFKLYLDAAAFDGGGQLPLRLCLAIHRDLSRIDPAPFRYIQCVALAAAGAAPDFVGPVPGAYHLLAGRLPEPESTAQRLRDAARRALAALDPAPLAESGRPWISWLVGQPPIVDGFIEVPDRPGFGVEVAPDLLGF